MCSRLYFELAPAERLALVKSLGHCLDDCPDRLASGVGVQAAEQ